ncbi:Crp/Fnr family transcriptional regulator [Sphingomicrobium lutaoense]|uniref:CRP/FNR family nitrogen fixation transcriptional regulator n=1 Tax=Sphingomicrobium lutaoense TaxID=515949 RepID=A0A839Z0P7_9SPHN|nr:helix-turn-helix domain-containing protein [Sphingomicrobium lutaoense]MBB3764919.1 CRP/FNR family nitrogen fixation transcriptional regulator [Sphingomicrobium lutaoense]
MTDMPWQRGVADRDCSLHYVGQRIALAGAGESIFREEEPSSLYVKLLSGAGRLLRYDEEGQRNLIAFVLPGEIAERPLAGRHRFTLEAASDCSYVLEEEGVVAPRLETGVALAGGVDRLAERGILLSRHHIPSRIAAFLLGIAPRLLPGGAGLRFPLSQVDMACYLATTPETICRTLRRFREQGLIEQPAQDRLVIRDEAGLRRAAGLQRRLLMA